MNKIIALTLIHLRPQMGSTANTIRLSSHNNNKLPLICWLETISVSLLRHEKKLHFAPQCVSQWLTETCSSKPPLCVTRVTEAWGILPKLLTWAVSHPARTRPEVCQSISAVRTEVRESVLHLQTRTVREAATVAPFPLRPVQHHCLCLPPMSC